MNTQPLISPDKPHTPRWPAWAWALLVIALGFITYAGMGAVLVHRMAYHRVEKLEYTPQELGLQADSVSLVSSDGVPLKAWWMTTENPRGVVLLLHGMDGIDASSLLPQAPILLQAGYDVLALDMRAHGRSGGDHIGFAFEEPRDIVAALDWVGQQPGASNLPLATLGYSMGGAAAIRAAAVRPDVDAVVSVSAFSSIDAMLAQGMRLMGAPDAVVTGLTPAIRLGMILNYGVIPDRASPVADIAKIAPRPVLLLHGSADSQVPVELAYQLQAAGGATTRLQVFPGADHLVFTGDGTGPENAEFWQVILGFLENNLQS